MQWKVIPHPKLKRDFIGRNVRTRRLMQNRLVSIPAGTIMRIERRPRTGAELVTAPCACCGIAAVLGRVEDRDFEFVEAVAGGTPAVAYNGEGDLPTRDDYPR